MPSPGDYLMARALPTAERAPRNPLKDFDSHAHPTQVTKYLKSFFLIYAKEWKPSGFRWNSQNEKNWKSTIRLK